MKRRLLPICSTNETGILSWPLSIIRSATVAQHPRILFLIGGYYSSTTPPNPGRGGFYAAQASLPCKIFAGLYATLTLLLLLLII